MIYGLVGKPGGGKSYEAVAYHIIPAVKSGRKVITNLPLNIEAFVAVFGAEKVAELIEIRTKALGVPVLIGKQSHSSKHARPFSSLECFEDSWRDENNKGALFVIDECHLVLGRGRTSLPITEWFSMHRHQGFDLLLITQNFRKVDADICDMIELVYYVTKNTMLGSSKTYTKKVKDGLRGDTVDTEQRKYEKKYFKFYQSHTMSNKAVLEANASDVKNIYNNWFTKGAILIGIAALFMVYKSYSLGQEKKAELAQIAKNQRAEAEKKLLAKLPAKTISSSTVGVPVPVPVTVPVETKTESIKLFHPYHKMTFSIGGSFTTQEGINNVLFIAAQNGQPMFTMTFKDFALAGYDIQYKSRCMVELTYKDFYHDFITCDSPRIGLNVAQTNKAG